MAVRISGAIALWFQRGHKRRQTDLPTALHDTDEIEWQTREQVSFILSIFYSVLDQIFWIWILLLVVCLCTFVFEGICTNVCDFPSVHVYICVSIKAFGRLVCTKHRSNWCQRRSSWVLTNTIHTNTHTSVLCPNPHITPHLVMKTSSIIPLDRPQGPNADSSSWRLLFVDWTSQIRRPAAHTLYYHFI